MGGILGGLAVIRVLINDLAFYTREPFIPIFNNVALPSLIVADVFCMRSCLQRDGCPTDQQRANHVGIAGVTGVVLLWLVLSFECYGYFVSRSLLDDQIEVWRWRGHLALTVFWDRVCNGSVGAGVPTSTRKVALVGDHSLRHHRQQVVLVRHGQRSTNLSNPRFLCLSRGAGISRTGLSAFQVRNRDTFIQVQS